MAEGIIEIISQYRLLQTGQHQGYIIIIHNIIHVYRNVQSYKHQQCLNCVVFSGNRAQRRCSACQAIAANHVLAHKCRCVLFDTLRSLAYSPTYANYLVARWNVSHCVSHLIQSSGYGRSRQTGSRRQLISLCHLRSNTIFSSQTCKRCQAWVNY